AINKIEKYHKNIPIESRNLLSIYKEETKEKIDVCMNLLLEMAYYMRGWKAENDIPPIKDASFAPELTYVVQGNAWNSLSAYEKYIEELEPDIKDVIKKLPLMKVQKEHGSKDFKFTKSNEEENGFTILDRVNIVKKGETDIHSYSCIRLS